MKYNKSLCAVIIALVLFLSYECYLIFTSRNIINSVQEIINSSNTNSEKLVFECGDIDNSLYLPRLNISNLGFKYIDDSKQAHSISIKKITLGWNILLNKLYIHSVDDIMITSKNNEKDVLLLCNYSNKDYSAFVRLNRPLLADGIKKVQEASYKHNGLECKSIGETDINIRKSLLNNIYYSNKEDKINVKVIMSNDIDNNSEHSIMSVDANVMLKFQQSTNGINLNIYKVNVRGNDFNVNVNGRGILHHPYLLTGGRILIILDNYDNFFEFIASMTKKPDVEISRIKNKIYELANYKDSHKIEIGVESKDNLMYIGTKSIIELNKELREVKQ